MATTLTVKDPKATDSAGLDLSDATLYTTIVVGTGVEYSWEGTGSVLLKNAHGSSSRDFTVTVPVPSGTGLTAVGSTPSSKVYAVASGKTQYVQNADAFRNPTDGKVTINVSGSDCSAMAIAL